METARELFFEQGYAQTGIAQILKVCGVNSGSLYHFFPSKEDLLAAVLEKYKTLLQSRVLAPAFERISDPSASSRFSTATAACCRRPTSPWDAPSGILLSKPVTVIRKSGSWLWRILTRGLAPYRN